MRTSPTDMRWVWRGSALALLVVGWTFIAFANNFHITPPVVFIGLGYLAAIATVWNLWRTGAAAVAGNPEDAGQAEWGRPLGARGELEREKRTLLKAIKETEFDHQMGKLSDADADKLIHTYRARAIQVIRELEDPGISGTVRDEIQREVRARLEIEAHRKQPAKRGGKKSKKTPEVVAEAAAEDANVEDANVEDANGAVESKPDIESAADQAADSDDAKSEPPAAEPEAEASAKEATQ